MITAPVIECLPDDYLLLIGEIVTAWSLEELALRQTVFAMLNLSEARGRIAIRMPRAKEMVEMICDLAMTYGFQVDVSGLSLLGELENRRNLVAHSIWLMSPNGIPMIQDLQGTWPKQGHRPIKKRLQPGGIEVRIENLQDLLAAIRKITLNTYDVAQAIRERIAACQKTHPAPSHQ